MADSILRLQVGFLRAICEKESYFTPERVATLEIAWDRATEKYGEGGVPAADDVIFQSWDGKPVLIGLLPRPDQKAALPFVRCAAASMQTVGNAAIDMLVLLIGPEGSENDVEWMRAAAAVEIDDRVCRKLVWLPGFDAYRSAEDFLARTPFARPWRGRRVEGDATSLNRLTDEEDMLDRIALEADKKRAASIDFVRSALASMGK